MSNFNVKNMFVFLALTIFFVQASASALLSCSESQDVNPHAQHANMEMMDMDSNNNCCEEACFCDVACSNTMVTLTQLSYDFMRVLPLPKKILYLQQAPYDQYLTFLYKPPIAPAS